MGFWRGKTQPAGQRDGNQGAMPRKTAVLCIAIAAPVFASRRVAAFMDSSQPRGRTSPVKAPLEENLSFICKPRTARSRGRNGAKGPWSLVANRHCDARLRASVRGARRPQRRFIAGENVAQIVRRHRLPVGFPFDHPRPGAAGPDVAPRSSRVPAMVGQGFPAV